MTLSHNIKRNILICLVIVALAAVSFSAGCQNTHYSSNPINVSILAVNDFHGHLYPEQELNCRPAGSAPILASYLNSAMDSSDADYTVIALTGDTIGASPVESALLQDEPAIEFFNSLVNNECNPRDSGKCTKCNLISIPGNHEFNDGMDELMRIIYGGNGDTKIQHITNPYPGAMADYICANVVWKDNKTPVFPPYTIREINGAKMAFIGAVTTETTILELPQNIEEISFINESEAINSYVPEIQEQGIHAIVVLLHNGGNQEAYSGPTRKGCNVTGPVTGIVSELDEDVDVVLAAHTHDFINAYLPNAGGKDVLVAEAYAYGAAYADVELLIDPHSNEIIRKSAVIVPVYADQSPGTSPDPAAEKLLSEMNIAVSKLRSEVIATSEANISRIPDVSGESALGSLVADSQRAAMKTDIALVTAGTLPGSIQADLPKGNITWEDLEAVLPADASIAAEYGGWYSRPHVASREITGEQIKTILERQWQEPLPEEYLSVSGITYAWDPSLPAGSKVTEVLINGVPLDEDAIYTAAMNYYMAYGNAMGGGVLAPPWDWEVNVNVGPADIDALINYIQGLPQPLDMINNEISVPACGV
ncbi:bifunctional metallophosphatase/5'-nucleotidase [Methanomicrobium antiquum]|uniref:Bifunctional metallophosphatase/5'-nucleotidase n=1 Tax=Methanomicrobium antiquum TaxID=487686 RepID=A0AAF0FZF7_9EURY|nr:bifunctional metallophosphatase/5'-nucleotidase [Methanomicrobium antiquum]WFN37309.1 bifunctional metallophosphatase/5'-nucleotidase [Methanomicrobium antiquum]